VKKGRWRGGYQSCEESRRDGIQLRCHPVGERVKSGEGSGEYTLPWMTKTGHRTLLMRSAFGKMSQHAKSRDEVNTLTPERMGECKITPAQGCLEAR
jgi:hypothetical protein